jgi:hypothetical protein
MRTDWTTLAFCAVISFTVSLSVSLLSAPQRQTEPPLVAADNGIFIPNDNPRHVTVVPETQEDCIRRLAIGAMYDRSGWLTANIKTVIAQQCHRDQPTMSP